MGRPDRWAIALCAPDRETDAAVTLFRAGEKAAEIRPDRLLAGSSRIYLITRPAFTLPPFEFAEPPRRPAVPFTPGLPPLPPFLITGC